MLLDISLGYDFKVIAYFAIMFQCAELALFFSLQKARSPETRPTWLLSFASFFAGATIMQSVRAYVGLATGLTPGTVDLLNRVNYLVIAFMAVFIASFARQFLKRGFKAGNVIWSIMLASGFFVLVINVVNFLTSTVPSDYLLAITGITLIGIDFLIPMMLVIDLLRHGEAHHRRHFLTIFAGITLAVIGIVVHSQPLEPRVQALFPSDHEAFVAWNLVLIMCSLGMVMTGFFLLPPTEEFFWTEKLVALYLLDRERFAVLYKKGFSRPQSAAPGMTTPATGADNPDLEGVLAGSIKGITDLLREIIDQGEKDIQYIDQGALKLTMQHHGTITFLLVSKEYHPILKLKLYNLMQTFLIFYGDYIRSWVNSPERFAPVDHLVDQTFSNRAGTRKTKRKDA
ncbi:MAG: hypothetical protein JW839_00565 [Candidatus Lokiarchaeota archaeon]|nr:hypothetical protein [Candidatus Lokiarchaeota archaeon]